MKLDTRDPHALSLHPSRKALPALPGWEKDGDHFNALVENIRFRGIDKPLILDPEDRIIDGEYRWRAAKQLQLETIPVSIRPGDDAASILVAAAATKKRLPTQSALAFYTYPILSHAFEESRQHRIDHLKQGPVSANLHLRGKPRKIEDFADEIGVSRHLLFDAKKVYTAFDEHPEPRDITDENGELHEGITFRAYYTRRILLGEVRLGAVIAGIAGHLNTKGKPKGDRGQLTLFKDPFEKGILRFRYYKDLDAQARAEADASITRFVTAMPDPIFDKLKRAVREREKK